MLAEIDDGAARICRKMYGKRSTSISSMTDIMKRQMKQVEQFKKMERKKIPGRIWIMTTVPEPSDRGEAEAEACTVRSRSDRHPDWQAYRRRTCQYCLFTLLLQDQEGRNNEDDRMKYNYCSRGCDQHWELSYR